MAKNPSLSRRSTLKGLCGAGALSMLGADVSFGAGKAAAPKELPAAWSDTRKQLWSRVFQTPLVDTHEHLIEEDHRLARAAQGDDWTYAFSHYFSDDMTSAGMPSARRKEFFSHASDPAAKWKAIEPWWPAVRNTGYGQAVRIAMRELYGIPDLNAKTVAKLQEGYERVRRPGFYREILCERAGISSCQVNSLEGTPFMESKQPALLMQDIGIAGMFDGPKLDEYAKPAGIEVKDLDDWHRVIDWWFNRYGRRAVAVKSPNAYKRDIDYVRTDAEVASPVFAKVLKGEKPTPEEKKRLEDHLFWYAVDRATKEDLPVKLHTGYYVGTNHMPLGRLRNNPASACELCRAAPDTRFVFMHIGYPYYEEMIALAKQYTNAHIDMCWAWIVDPASAGDFLKRFLVTAPASKVFTFGGDYIPVEPVLGHAILARQGIVLALSQLVDEGWLDLDGALALVDPIMHGNAEEVFRLEKKLKILGA